ncbi:DUF6477 family protein [Jannaschia sp. M317]|uniref:DUF6477 family protein n=1 Tax=Jannaschia sp. M317 TaxID=2867011 RepID=UPI0021A81F46|nr:DUF6477 family protein [Jannaschia sp. M317]UWQ16611.1 hypothetical protein K3551_11890 [Jannaschia sp. M317]
MTKTLNDLNRPGLLVQAAAHGTGQYERRRDLRRMLRVAIPGTARAALEKLLPIEAELEKRRRERATTYSFARHVDILAALLAEARSFRGA